MRPRLGDAIPDFTNDLLVIYDEKVIGEAKAAAVGEDERVSVRLRREPFEQLVLPVLVKHGIDVKTYEFEGGRTVDPEKIYTLRCNPFTGAVCVIGSEAWKEFTESREADAEFNALFEKLSVVDKYWFKRGHVPEWFKRVEGFGSLK